MTYQVTPGRIKVRVSGLAQLLSMGLIAALEREPGLDAREDALHDESDDSVVIADYGTALRLIMERRAKTTGARVVILASEAREAEVRRALTAGVTGYVLLGSSIAQLADAVRTVAKGQKYLCQGAAQCIADSLTHESLTPREDAVLQLLAQGQCNKLIANQLDIALGTVKTHIKAILEKLEAKNRTHAVRMASARGLVSEGVTRLARYQPAQHAQTAEFA